MKVKKFGAGRTKRYAEGGLNVEDMKQGIASGFRAEAPVSRVSDESETDAHKSGSFGAAFKRNRAAGEKSFEFNGKKYTTELKGSEAKSKSGATVMRPSDAEIADIKAKQSEAKAELKDTSRIDSASAPGPKVGEASKVAAVRPKDKPTPAVRIEPHFREPRSINSPEQLSYKDSKRLTGPRSGGGSGGGGGNSRNLMLGADLDPKALMRETRAARNEDESRFADEGNPNFRKGGKVKKMATGGKVRSASSRADGCAIRGKTRA